MEIRILMSLASFVVVFISVRDCPLDVSPDLVDAYLFRLPRAYMFADYIWPGLLMSADRLKEIRQFQFRKSDVLICSYPKSGTTWVSEIVSLICHRGDVDEVGRVPLHDRVPWLELDNSYVWVQFFWLWQLASKFLGLSSGDAPSNKKTESQLDGGPAPPEGAENANSDQEMRRVFFTHLPLELLPQSGLNTLDDLFSLAPSLDAQCTIIYVARNPKDNAVSFFHFHQMARFLGLQKTSWQEFFPLYTVGKIYCGSWFEHVLSFWRFAKVNERVLFLKYEDMKLDLRAAVESICSHVKIDLSPEIVDRMTRHCTFSSMKDNKMANRAGVWLFNQSISKFMRKGVVGDWKNYFTVAQNDLFDEVYRARMQNTGLNFEFE